MTVTYPGGGRELGMLPSNESLGKKRVGFKGAMCPAAKAQTGCLGSLYRKLFPGLPTYNHPAAQQPRPFGLNRYVLLLLYVVYVTATGGVHYGWRNISNMLMRSGAYVWLCNTDASGAYIRDSPADASYMCNAQDKAVQALFSVSIALQFFMAGVSGFLIDHIGPKLTACLGQTLSAASWVLLAFCSSSLNGYTAVYVLLGMGADTGFLPTLVICNLFPGFTALCLTILGAAVSASFAMPVILDTTWESHPDLSFRDLCLWYAGVANGGCFIAAILFLPWKSFKGEDQFPEVPSIRSGAVKGASNNGAREFDDAGDVEKQQKKGSDGGKKELKEDGRCDALTPPKRGDSGVFAWNEKIVTPSLGHQDTGDKSGFGDNNDNSGTNTCGSATVAGTAALSEVDSGPEATVQGGSSRGSSEGFFMKDFTIVNDRALKGGTSKAMCASISEEQSHSAGYSPANRRSFVKQLLSKYYLCIVVYFTLMALAFVFYTLAAERLLQDVEEFMKVVVPFSFVPCVIIGKCIDSFGIMPVIFCMNLVGTLMYATLIAGVVGLQYVSVLLYVVYVSVFTSQLYCYVEATFSSLHFGKLIGIAACIGGLLSLTSQAIYDWIVDSFNGTLLVPCLVFTSVMLANFGLIVYMIVIKRKNPRPFDHVSDARADGGRRPEGGSASVS